MKIAVVTDNGKTISQHFGRARHYVVMTIEDGQIVGQEIRDRHASTQQADANGVSTESDPSAPTPPVDNHTSVAALIADCDVVLSRGMGRGMHHNLQRAGVRPVMTNIAIISTAVTAYLEGRLKEYPDLVH